MPLRVLSVAYPFAPVGLDAVGGAEQILTALDYALVRSGHQSTVIGCEGSTSAAKLLPVPRIKGVITHSRRAQIHQCVFDRLQEALATEPPFDLVHMHGLDFHKYLPLPGVPVLVTLHLPPSWYPKHIFTLDRPQTFLHCVSPAQRRACPPSALLLPEINNGVAVSWLSRARHAKRRFVVSLGRICPEKGFHHALDAARAAGVPMLLAGDVFAYPAHQEYFQSQITPRLDRCRRFVGPAGHRRKRRLLGAARCLLIPSLAPETSSLVAMEALACGTPVIAFPSGALCEIVEHGRTGFLVSDTQEMAAAIRHLEALRPEECRAAARARFSSEHMVRDYFAVYRRLAESANRQCLVEARS